MAMGAMTVGKKKADPGKKAEPEKKAEPVPGISMRLVLDKELHHAVRKAAANDNKSMAAFLRDLIGYSVLGRKPAGEGK